MLVTQKRKALVAVLLLFVVSVIGLVVVERRLASFTPEQLSRPHQHNPHPTRLEKISPLVRKSIVAIEDGRFFEHSGVDYLGIARALVTNIRYGSYQMGGSTITMQLAKNVNPHPRTLVGKLGQFFDAYRIERAYSKKQILEHYLNRIYYGAGNWGIEQASQAFFAKPSRQLTLAEAALLSGLPQAPGNLNPFVDPAAAKRRQQQVLRALRSKQLVTEQEYAVALRQPLHFALDR